MPNHRQPRQTYLDLLLKAKKIAEGENEAHMLINVAIELRHGIVAKILPLDDEDPSETQPKPEEPEVRSATDRLCDAARVAELSEHQVVAALAALQRERVEAQAAAGAAYFAAGGGGLPDDHPLAADFDRATQERFAIERTIRTRRPGEPIADHVLYPSKFAADAVQWARMAAE